jgi:hypothetical protein
LSDFGVVSTSDLKEVLDGVKEIDRRIRYVRHLHSQEEIFERCLECHQGWPCDTILALNGEDMDGKPI